MFYYIDWLPSILYQRLCYKNYVDNKSKLIEIIILDSIS